MLPRFRLRQTKSIKVMCEHFYSSPLASQESCARFIYKPPPGFVGEDSVTVRVSDGGLGGAFNLTGELGFRVKVPWRKGLGLAVGLCLTAKCALFRCSKPWCPWTLWWSLSSSPLRRTSSFDSDAKPGLPHYAALDTRVKFCRIFFKSFVKDADQVPISLLRLVPQDLLHRWSAGASLG